VESTKNLTPLILKRRRRSYNMNIDS